MQKIWCQKEGKRICYMEVESKEHCGRCSHKVIGEMARARETVNRMWIRNQRDYPVKDRD